MLQKIVMAMLLRRCLKIFPKQIGSTEMMQKVRTYYHPRIFHLMSLVFWGLHSLCSPTAALGLLLRIYASQLLCLAYWSGLRGMFGDYA